MKITLDTKDKTIALSETFTIKDITELSKYIPDIENWNITSCSD